jgi:hypothetical protein
MNEHFYLKMGSLSTGTSSIMRTDAGFIKVDECTVPLSGHVAVRAYSDTRPHNLHLAVLQKGLVFVKGEIEAIGEGTGFGVPILRYADHLYFSGSSDLYLLNRDGHNVIRKEFLMDTIPKKRIGNVNLEGWSLISLFECAEELYRRHRRLRFLTLKSLSNAMGLRSQFVRTAPVGKVITTYRIWRDSIQISTDIGHVRAQGLEKVFVLNEQGSRYFSRYSDSEGTVLTGKEVGAWDDVDAESASITDPHSGVGFRLYRRGNSVLRRGREYLRGHLDWIGIDYEVDPKGPMFAYGIDILGG